MAKMRLRNWFEASCRRHDRAQLHRLTLLRSTALVTVGLAFSQPAWAQLFTYIGPDGGTWSAGPWSTPLVGGATTELIFEPGMVARSTTTNDLGAFTLNRVTSNSPFYNAVLTINAMGGSRLIFDGVNPGASTVGSLEFNTPLQLNSSTLVSAGYRIAFNGRISGPGQLTILGSGYLLADAAHTGGTRVFSALTIGDGGTVGSLSGDTELFDGALAFDRSDAVIHSGAVSGTGWLDQVGSGTLTLTGNSTFTGTTAVESGTLQIGNGGTTGALSSDILNLSRLIFNRSDDVTYGGGISGTGQVSKLGAGTLTLTGANTHSGGTTIVAGTLAIGNGGTAGSIAGDITNNAALVFNRSDDLTYSGEISGIGSLTKLGAGTLALAGANAYSGGTRVDAGVIRISHNTALGTGPVDLLAGTGLQTASNITMANAIATGGARIDTVSNILTLNGLISGAGWLEKTGSGTLLLPGSNFYAGGTRLNAGTLAIQHANALGTGALEMAGGARLDARGSFTLSNPVTLSNGTAFVDTGANNFGLAGAISGAGALAKTGTGTLTLSGANSYTGATWIQEGTLRTGWFGALSNQTAVQISAGATLDLNGFGQTVGSLSGTGNVLLGGAVLHAGGNNTSTTFGGTISGAGSLFKSGTGTLTLNGTNTHTGVTHVFGGRLVVDGSVMTPVAVMPGATLGGSGSVGATAILSGGTLSPGNSPGTLTVNGNLTLDPGATYVAELQGALADRVNVTGTASLAGTLRIVPLGGAYLFKSPYTLLSATGGIAGAFSPVDATGSFGDGVTTTVDYTANDVRLTLTPKPLVPIVVPPTSSARLGVTAPANAHAVASAIDGAVARGADASPLFNLYNQPAAAIPAAVNQLSGEAHTAVPALGFQAANQFLGAMLDLNGRGRLAGAPGGPNGAAGFTADLPSKRSDAGPATLDPAHVSLWGATFGSRGRTEGEHGVGSANRTRDDAHLAVGADVLLAPGTVAGLAVAGGKARASLSGGLGKIESDVFQAGLYGQTRLGPVNLAAAAGYARLDNDVHRAVPVLGNGLSSSYASTAWSGRLQASGQLASWNGFSLSPLAALQAVQVHSPAFVERAGLGGNAGTLSVTSRNDVTSRSELGVQLDGQTSMGAVPVTGFVRASWAHYFEHDASLTASLIALPGTSFSAAGARPDRNAGLIAAGLDARLTDRISLGARLDSELSGNTRSLGGTARIAVSF